MRVVGRTLNAGADDIVLGQRFTKATVESLPLDRFRVLYFATHGLLPGELQCLTEPALIVSADAGSTEGNSAFLESSEISRLKLDSDLVVLSACNTAGPGAELGGESLSGLARSFFYAGTRAMIVSHWSIPSEETAQVMTDTFGRINGDTATQKVAASLRQAKLRLLETGRTAVARPQGLPANAPYWTHPYFWGALVVVGSTIGGPAS